MKLSSARDLTAWLGQVRAQFRNLDPRNPAFWPVWPRHLLLSVIVLLVPGLLWLAWLEGVDAELTMAREHETALRSEFKAKLSKAVNLAPLKKQREEVLHHVTQLEKQLPSKAEMDALLSDINQAGLGRSLSFELFRPGQVVVKEYYAELPITLRVSGRYHDMGEFASDIAHLSRIVTLNNLSIAPATPPREGMLLLDATARTYRYLDPEEVAAQKKVAAAAKGAKK